MPQTRRAGTVFYGSFFLVSMFKRRTIRASVATAVVLTTIFLSFVVVSWRAFMFMPEMDNMLTVAVTNITAPAVEKIDTPALPAPTDASVVVADEVAKKKVVSINQLASATTNSVAKKTGAPVRIKIPSLNVNATIERVTLAADGSMDVPKDPDNAGWYALGPRPGETGSAAIAGHVNWWGGVKGVFEHLSALKPGDIITIENDFGKNIYFVVREARTYDADADATEIFSTNDGKAHLNLITCTGLWDKGAQQYAKRLVVFADLE
jgi:LPXTG-site transpeptidase (sortase) family protein